MATFELFDTDEKLLSLKGRWDEILAKKKCNASVFQTFEWNYYGWKVVESKKFPESHPYVLYVTCDGHGTQRAILPFRLDSDGVLKFLCTSLTDVQDAIVPSHDENWSVFFTEIAKYIIGRPEIKRLDLTKMEATSEMLAYLGVEMPNGEISKYNAHSILKLGNTEEFSQSFKHIDAKGRKRIRRLIRSYDDLEFRVYDDPLVQFPFEKIVKLRDHMVFSGKRVLASCTDDAIRFMGELYERGFCDIATLVDSSNEFSLVQFRPKIGNRIVFWIALYKDGKMVSAASAKYMAYKTADSDMVTIDFGTGLYSYKLGTFHPEVIHLFALRKSVAKSPTIMDFLHDEYRLLHRYAKGFLQVLLSK